MSRQLPLVALVVLSTACGDVNGLSDERLPIMRIPILLHEDGVELTGIDGNTRFYVALVWGRLPANDPFCSEAPEEGYADPELAAIAEAGCGAPVAWEPDVVASVVSVPPEARQNDGTFWFPIYDLPETYQSTLVGSLIAFIDNGNGVLDQFSRGEPLAGNDVILGATLTRDVLIVYRDSVWRRNSGVACEGVGCSVATCNLSAGFSEVFVGNPRCEPEVLGGRDILLPITRAPDLSYLRCHRYGVNYGDPYFSEAAPYVDREWACVNDGHLVVADDPTYACPALTHYLLDCDPSICWDDEDKTVPSWWPCHGTDR